MMKFSETVRKRMGWCPNTDAIRGSRCSGVEQNCEHAWKHSGPDPGAAPESDTPAAKPPGYQENILLILIAVAWLFPVVYQQEFLFLLMVISAVAVYCDAQNIHAGDTFEKETLLGDIVVWRPLTWGAATFVGGIIIMAIYLFHRKEIYVANMEKASS